MIGLPPIPVSHPLTQATAVLTVSCACSRVSFGSDKQDKYFIAPLLFTETMAYCAHCSTP